MIGGHGLRPLHNGQGRDCWTTDKLRCCARDSNVFMHQGFREKICQSRARLHLLTNESYDL